MQQLWIQKISWDDPIPSSILTRWRELYTQLSLLNQLSIPRWTCQQADTVRTELHGFADASSSAYAAVVYLRVSDASGRARVSLLAGKSKVAPVTPMSIPRLELSAAVLLSKLVRFVRDSVACDACYCWSDSMVVLAWLRRHPADWKTFIANRVADVQSRLPGNAWRHVPTKDNPADCASRGLSANDLLSHSLWWRGPSWLSSAESDWPSHVEPSLPGQARVELRHVAATVTSTPQTWDLSTRYSSWSKLIRVTAYVLRFIRRCRSAKIRTHSDGTDSSSLSAEDFRVARTFWIKRIQAELFPCEITSLLSGKPISSRSSLLALNPFVDEDGLLRVGGRLRAANIPFNQKHPMILASHPLVALLVSFSHVRMLHSGHQLTLSTLRQEFWILRARTVIRAVLHRCVRCARERATIPAQLMGNLPVPRVSTSARSFIHCGIDYAGPILVRPSSRRGLKANKAYIALFVCLATKAVHLELVGDYSTPAFLNAFSRFCARRGLPQAMYSDNGTTFVGADRDLTKAYHQALRDPEVLSKTASDNVAWHFIPPAAPHFGGLWEAGVRSLKHHLRRVVGNQVLTGEEFATFLCRVEACLNSRPLAPFTASADDYEVLTPGHFLIGANLAIPPEPSVLSIAENRLSRWQLIRQLTERLWKVWKNDYLHSLQQRVKWKKSEPPFQQGQLVLLRSPNLPPCKWELGRVTKCHPGADGLVRVVTVQTANSEYVRPIVKLCLLPIDIENHNRTTTEGD